METSLRARCSNGSRDLESVESAGHALTQQFIKWLGGWWGGGKSNHHNTAACTCFARLTLSSARRVMWSFKRGCSLPRSNHPAKLCSVVECSYVFSCKRRNAMQSWLLLSLFKVTLESSFSLPLYSVTSDTVRSSLLALSCGVWSCGVCSLLKSPGKGMWGWVVNSILTCSSRGTSIGYVGLRFCGQRFSQQPSSALRLVVLVFKDSKNICALQC